MRIATTRRPRRADLRTGAARWRRKHPAARPRRAVRLEPSAPPPPSTRDLWRAAQDAWLH